MKPSLRIPVLLVALLAGFAWPVETGAVLAQESAPETGTLVVALPADGAAPLAGRVIEYRQVSADFLTGFEGQAGASLDPSATNLLNLEVRCIPWAAEESAGSGQPEDLSPAAGMTVANECLLYFGEDAAPGLPADLAGLPFDTLLVRMQDYLERAVREQVADGISLFILREPAYPTSNLLDLTASQWRRLIRQACTTIRTVAPGARIAIEIVPQYLPSRGYTPYTFLDNLIRDGAPFDLILFSISPPVWARFTRSGYPDPAWLVSQLNVYADLGRQFLVRFSGIGLLGAEEEYQPWLDLMLQTVYAQPTVIGIYWNDLSRHPYRLTAVEWGKAPQPSPDPVALERIQAFVREHASQGEVSTDSNGQAVIQAYAGEYALNLDGEETVALAHIFRGEERRLQLPAKIVDLTPAYVAPTTQYPGASGPGPRSASLRIAFLGLVLCMAAWGLCYRRNKARMNIPH